MKEHKARKRFGQNFLQDTRIIGDIVNAVRPQADDVVIEIGPGLAAITEPLAKKLNCLHVVEIDQKNKFRCLSPPRYLEYRYEQSRRLSARSPP
nr:rRNA adenine N-6-methyltransferase family protein [Escherichia coli]